MKTKSYKICDVGISLFVYVANYFSANFRTKAIMERKIKCCFVT